eukprot:scaffold191893_cov12-Tisochrysis_lutea.AAC.1
MAFCEVFPRDYDPSDLGNEADWPLFLAQAIGKGHPLIQKHSKHFPQRTSCGVMSHNLVHIRYQSCAQAHMHPCMLE